MMRQLDEESREKEILNLPESYLSGLQRYGAAPVDRKDIIAETRSCAQELFRHDSTRPTSLDSFTPLEGTGRILVHQEGLRLLSYRLDPGKHCE